MDEPCERMDEQQRTPLSNQQLAQLIRSLILVEQVVTLRLTHRHIYHRAMYNICHLVNALIQSALAVVMPCFTSGQLNP